MFTKAMPSPCASDIFKIKKIFNMEFGLCYQITVRRGVAKSKRIIKELSQGYGCSLNASDPPHRLRVNMSVPKLSRVRYEGRVGGINLILNAQTHEYMNLVPNNYMTDGFALAIEPTDALPIGKWLLVPPGQN
jgi:hypothetical protein